MVKEFFDTKELDETKVEVDRRYEEHFDEWATMNEQEVKEFLEMLKNAKAKHHR